MNLRLEPITKENREACISICSTKEQNDKKLTLPVAESLKLAAEMPNIARPFAISDGDRIIGFTMFAFDEEWEKPEDRYWLWQLKIDKRYQGKGYAQAILPIIIQYFKEYGVGEITLSTKPDNDNALHIYRKFSFRENGEMNEDEIILKLQMK